MARSLSAATRMKIARSLKGNKNAFRGGPKARLSTREKIANINASTKAKKANLSSDQVARRQAVAKRLRAQARREEALGGGNPAEMKTNKEIIDQALAKSDRLAAGAIETVNNAKNVNDLRRGLAQVKEARAALKEGMPQSARKESTAKVQPKAKQKLNAPQTPPEQKSAVMGNLSATQRRRQQASKFEADQAKARASDDFAKQMEFDAALQSGGGRTRITNSQAREAAAQARRARGAEERIAARATPEGRASLAKARKDAFDASQRTTDNVVVPGSRKGGRKTDPIRVAARERKAQDQRLESLKAREEKALIALNKATDARRKRGSRIQSTAEVRARGKFNEIRRQVSEVEMSMERRGKPQPRQSDTGSDRTQFSSDTPVTKLSSGASLPSGSPKKESGLIETEADYQKFVADSTPALIQRLAKGMSAKDMADFREALGKELGKEGIEAFNQIMKMD